MNTIYILWVLIAFLFFYFLRVILGPSIWDRLLGMNLISTKIVIIITVFASINKSAYMLDFAIIYSLFGFIGVIFTALYLLERAKQKEKEKTGV